jgi:hypothetical protein
VPDADLVGAQISFVEAMILEHNGILARNGLFIIDPLRVVVSKGKGLEKTVLLDRSDGLNPLNPSMPLWEATSQMLLRRQPKRFIANSWEVAAATRLTGPTNEALIANRDARCKSLEELLAHPEKLGADEQDRANQIAALNTRIEQLKIVRKWWDLTEGTHGDRPIDRRAYTLALQLEGWDIDMNGLVGNSTIKGDPGRPWPLRFWFGGWDGDALCAYARGSWEIPQL